MERAPRRVKDKDTDAIFDFIFRNGMGSPVILTAVPTMAQMKANTWGVYSADLYVKFANNVLLKFSGTIIA